MSSFVKPGKNRRRSSDLTKSINTSHSTIRVSGDLQAGGFKKSNIITSSIPTTPPWLLSRPVVNFTLHCSDKSNTPPEIFKHRFYEVMWSGAQKKRIL